MSDTPVRSDSPWTIQRLLAWTRAHFTARGVSEPRLAAEILLAKALGCRRIELYARFDRVPEAGQLDLFRDLVKRAADHAPISYLVGCKEFYSLEFEVSPDVLIPRPETELLVQQTMDTVRAMTRAEVNILDLCTGSGCVVVALLSHLPQARAVATDISAAALAVALRNAERHQVHDRVRFVEADRLALPDGCVPPGGFDAIACNPPYVASDEMAHLDRNIREYEPAIALTDGADGLSFYRSLAEHGGRLLAPGGALVVEIADGQAAAVRAVFTAGGRWTADGAWRDKVVGHERVQRYRPAAGARG